MRQVRHSAKRKPGGTSRESDVTGINSLKDEMDYWTEVSQSTSGDAKDRASAFLRHLTPIAQ
eukprot:313253-Amorphochlora_amoeboformis.AAC.1